MPRPNHSEHVLQQLNNQREWGFLCDCCIAIGDIYFRAHKAVLAACSSYFRMMFIKDQQVMARLNLSNLQISAECFDLILQLMYLGRIVVGPYEFEELKAAMTYLQLYYIPESLEDLKDITGVNLDVSSCVGPANSKMLFGVRMYEHQRRSSGEAEHLQPATSSTSTVQSSSCSSNGSRAMEEITLPLVTPLLDGMNDQPCDLRKKPSGKSSTFKERPRFGRTYTCDDCGFVFSCEKLLIEHILTCTNRKAFSTPKLGTSGDNDFSKTESSASESSEEQSIVYKMDTVWPEQKPDGENQSGETVIKAVRLVGDGTQPLVRSGLLVKSEPEEASALDLGDIKVVQVTDNCMDGCIQNDGYNVEVKECHLYVKEKEVGRSVKDDRSGDLFEVQLSKKENKASLMQKPPVKEETADIACITCEVCGVSLLEEDQSSHYIACHMGHICACGKCGQILIKGRQLQEHAQNCGETQDLETDVLVEEPICEDKPLLDDTDMFDSDIISSCQIYKDGQFVFRCPHCGQHFENEKSIVEHISKCTEQEVLRNSLVEESERDHRRKHFCSICGKGFYQRCHLREHYTVHTREKQFTCQTCGKQFLRERQLRLHNDMHKGMARYLCPVCDQGTFLKHDHVRHMISHLSAGETICQVCFQIFPNNDQLEQHMDVHLYICGVCGEKFRLRKDMRSHYNTKHTKKF
ncbi:zinc finger and BTB domain-containing protein 1 [Polypterus senegalus]|nr:zinc finger and BTB domain-containing protein 1 [Polypterus senegalus]